MTRREFVCGLVLVLATGVTAQSRSATYSKDLTAFFRELDKNYPFFKLKGIAKDWRKTKAALLKRAKKCKADEDFAAMVIEACRCLRDGHLRITKNKVKLPTSDPLQYPGVALLPATDGRVVVMGSTSGLASKLPPGTVVSKIAGKPARMFLDQRGEDAWQAGGFFSSPQRASFFAYRLPLQAKKGSKFVVEYLTKKGGKKKITLRCNQRVRGWMHNYHLPEGLQQSAKSVYHTKLPSGLGYIYLRRMDASAEDGFAKAMAAHKQVKGWIVDLRGNTGGGYNRSFKQKVAKLQRPVAGIIDAGCVSAGETFARDLVDFADAKLFGQVTAGSSSTKKEWSFPSGLMTIRFSTGTRRGLNRKGIEFVGIPPHVRVEAVPEELAAGKNSALLRAEAQLMEKNGGKK